MRYEKILEYVKRGIPDAEMISVQKTNTVLHGIRRAFSENDKTVVHPIVYLEYYDKVPEEEAALEIIHILKTAHMPKHLSADYIMENKYDMLRVRLIKQEWNNLNRPWVPLEDLAIVLYLCLDDNGEDCMTAQITNDVAEKMFPEYDLSKKEDLSALFVRATENTKKHNPVRIADMNRVMEELQNGYSAGTNNDGIFYVLTGEDFNMGAVTILYAKNELKELASKLGKDRLILLPSSIHEWLIVVRDDVFDKDGYEWLVDSVNGEAVQIYERLSDHPYSYDVKTGTLTLLEDE